MRCLFGAIFPLFATYMFNGQLTHNILCLKSEESTYLTSLFFTGIGINWGMTLIGCVAVVLVPMPFIFYFYGKKIRAKSKFAPAPDIEQDKVRKEEEEAEKV